MKRYSRAVILVLIQCLLFSGCSKGSEKTPVAEKVTDKSGPAKVEYSFDGTYAELDGDIAAINNQGGIELFNLKDNKVIKEIPASNKYGMSGLDISGDMVAWAEVNPQSVSQRDLKEPEKEEWNVYAYNYKTGERKQITKGTWVQSNPKIWKNYVIWQDNREDKTKEYPGRWSLYLYDLNTGIEKKITSTLAAHATYNISDGKIVWEDDRNFKGADSLRGGDNVPQNNKDIYMYDIGTGMESVVAAGKYMECRPDVSGNYIVWEDRNNNRLEADIVLYNLQNKEKVFVTKDGVDQGTPRIYGDYIVWMDERRGTSTNDVFIRGKAPNSDILIYDIRRKTERILTGDEPQILPCISSDWVAFILSRQIGAKVQVVKYK